MRNNDEIQSTNNTYITSNNLQIKVKTAMQPQGAWVQWAVSENTEELIKKAELLVSSGAPVIMWGVWRKARLIASGRGM